jgi:hypothetical protein
MIFGSHKKSILLTGQRQLLRVMKAQIIIIVFKSTMNLLTSSVIHQVFLFYFLLMFNNSSIFNGCDLKITSLIIFYKL